jgi:hypothetical protein
MFYRAAFSTWEIWAIRLAGAIAAGERATMMLLAILTDWATEAGLGFSWEGALRLVGAVYDPSRHTDHGTERAVARYRRVSPSWHASTTSRRPQPLRSAPPSPAVTSPAGAGARLSRRRAARARELVLTVPPRSRGRGRHYNYVLIPET